MLDTPCSVKSTGYPLHSPVSSSLPLPCVTACHHVSAGVYHECSVTKVIKSLIRWTPNLLVAWAFRFCRVEQIICNRIRRKHQINLGFIGESRIGSQFGTCFTSQFWSLEFGGSSQIYGNFVDIRARNFTSWGNVIFGRTSQRRILKLQLFPRLTYCLHSEMTW